MSRPDSASRAVASATWLPASAARRRAVARLPWRAPVRPGCWRARGRRARRATTPKSSAVVTGSAPAVNKSTGALSGERQHLARPLPAAGRAATASCTPGDDERCGAAEHGQQARFDEHQPEHGPARRADGEPHRHLGGAFGGPRHQQVGDVGAGDEQHEAGDGEQERDRSSGLRRGCRSGRGCAGSRTTVRARTAARAVRTAPTRCAGNSTSRTSDDERRPQPRFGLGHRHTRLEPRGHVDPPVPAALRICASAKRAAPAAAARRSARSRALSCRRTPAAPHPRSSSARC